MEEKKDQASTSLEAKPEDPNGTAVPSNGQDNSAATPGSDPNVEDATSGAKPPPAQPAKKGGIKALIRKVDIYFLGFLLLLVVGGAFALINYLNSKKAPPAPNAVSQNLTTDELKQLANSNASVGASGQTVTIQGNAIFSGEVLVQKDLAVAGGIKLGGQLQAQNFTATGTVSLASTQIQSLQVAQNSTLQGDVTIQHNLNVGGVSTFSGPITATQLTVTSLIMSGNAVLQIPNHLAFTGPSPGRAAGNTGAAGQGGSASIDGSDTNGTINVNTGANTQPGCFISITFNKPFTKTPHVIVSPVNSGAGQTQYYVTRTTTGMSLCTVNAAPTHSVFAYDYFVTD